MHKNRVLVVAAHPDDEVLGLGGTLARHYAEGAEISILFMSDGVTGRDITYDPQKRKSEIEERKVMAINASELIGCKHVEFLNLANLRMDQVAILDLTKEVEKRLDRDLPNIVYTHFISDTNIDHGITHKAVVAACRPVPERQVESLRFFEVASSTEYTVMQSGNDFVPNLFVDITDYQQEKLELISCYQQEMRKAPHPRSNECIKSRDRYRGASVGFHYAEAFIEARRLII